MTLVIINVFALTRLNQTSAQAERQEAVITKTRSELEGKSNSLKRVESEMTTIDASLKQEREKAQGLEQENQSLKVNLQAKKAQAAKQVAQTQPSTPKQNTAVAVSGTCASWLAQAGVSDHANAQELIRRESGCNPNAINPSSGACGVAQELPCGKSGCNLGDGACQIAWMQRYVVSRYGSWAGAIAFHNANNWY